MSTLPQLYINEKDFPTFDDVDKMLETVPKDISNMMKVLADFEDDAPYFASFYCMMKDAEIYSEDASVRINWRSKVFLVPEFTLRMALMAYKADPMSVEMFFEENFYDLIPSSMSSLFMNERTKDKVEAGQQKILTASLTPFLGLDKSKPMSVCVIGSAGPDGVTYSGSSYTVLAQLLTDAGYSGTMELYDPHEVGGVAVIGNFTLNYMTERFPYGEKNHAQILGEQSFKWKKTYDVVLDDAMDGIEEEVYTKIRPGLQKFVIDSKGKIQFMLKSHQATTLKPIGGGTVYYANKKVYQSPTGSGHFGFANYPGAIMANVGPRTLDPTNTIFSLAQRYSIKWPDANATMPDSFVEHQSFYKGTEVRMVDETSYKFLKARIPINFEIHPCQWCKDVAEKVSALGCSFQSYYLARGLTNACCPAPKVKSVICQNLLVSAARRGSDLRKAISEIARFAGVGGNRVRNELNTLVTQGKIRLETVDDNVVLRLLRAKQTSWPLVEYMKRNRLKLDRNSGKTIRSMFPSVVRRLDNVMGENVISFDPGEKYRLCYDEMTPDDCKGEIVFSNAGWTVYLLSEKGARLVK
jgi:hypothetical protein